MENRSFSSPATWQGSPLHWRGDVLAVLDQRRLPAEVIWIECRTALEVASTIRDMAIRGAPAIGCAAAFGLALDARRGASLTEAHTVLAASRPTAINLFWALGRMKDAIAAGRCAEREAITIYEEDVAANRTMGALGAALIPQGARVMTYCNTGALATAGYGTALGVIRAAHESGKRIRVWVNETRPYLQGARLTAGTDPRDPDRRQHGGVSHVAWRGRLRDRRYREQDRHLPARGAGGAAPASLLCRRPGVDL
jgi:methylthioribose-1-phosphate isomerase